VTRWVTAAHALGLEVDERMSGGLPIVHGEVYGLPVEAAVAIDPAYDGPEPDPRRYCVSATAWLERELDLGLMLVSRPPSWLRASATRVGHPKLEDFQIRALELDLARALFSIDELASRLEQFRNGSPALLMGDTFVKVERGADRAPEAHLPWLVRTAVRVAHAVVEARAKIGMSEGERALARAWSQVARELGLSVDLDHTKMMGRVGAIEVEADAFIERKVRKTKLVARFEHALGLELAIVRGISRT
jgi:hypothetical protein